MKILFYDTKPYDQEAFDSVSAEFPDISIDYLKTDISEKTAPLARGYDAVCLFVASDVGARVIDLLNDGGVKVILMRCAGFNNVDLVSAERCGITVMRVPGYAPEAVAEHILSLYRDDEKRKALGQAASEKALLFDEEAVLQQVKEIYLSV